jgi:hypothetical protein
MVKFSTGEEFFNSHGILRQLSTPLGERKEVVQLHPAHLACAHIGRLLQIG